MWDASLLNDISHRFLAAVLSVDSFWCEGMYVCVCVYTQAVRQRAEERKEAHAAAAADAPAGPVEDRK